MPGRPIITLTTDFGASSPYVAEMKAAVLSLCPDVHLVDITHTVPAQNVRYGAVVLHDVTRGFPAGTIHVAVVDPGVGTERLVVYADIGSQRYVAPDNGLLSLLADKQGCRQLITLDRDQYWRSPVSSTFHGRDVMAPVAAHLATGVEPARLGSPCSQLHSLDWPEASATRDGLTGHVLIIDSFGNLLTNIERPQIPTNVPLQNVSVRCEGITCSGVLQTYGMAAPGSLLALFGSSNRLEIAVNRGNAAERIGAEVGDEVQVTWAGGI